jgi:hypothetical protein
VDFRCATSVHCAEDQADLPYLRCDPPNRYLIGPGQWLEVGRDYGCGEGFNVIQGVLVGRGQLLEGSMGAAPSLLARHNHVVEAGLSLLAGDRGALLCGQEQCAWCSRARRMLAKARGDTRTAERRSEHKRPTSGLAGSGNSGDGRRAGCREDEGER